MEHKLTMRSFVAGYVLAIALCAINSYLTLSFGIMEEGPTIAALFFFAFFFWTAKKITVSEMVIVATMGSAGGSLGFISNFFAAQAMIVEKNGGELYSLWEMTVFGTVTSAIGLLAVIILRQILIVKDAEQSEENRLPWVGSKAVKEMIDALVTRGDPMQARYLMSVLALSVLYVVFNSEGVGWFPEAGMVTVFGLSAYGAGIAFSPFLWGGSYLMGMRTCVGFLVGGFALLVMAPHLETSAAPHKYVWPGVMFLVTSGLTTLLLKWRVMLDAVRSLVDVRGRGDADPIMSRNMMIVCAVIAVPMTIIALRAQFHLTLVVIVTMIAIGGLLLNVIATRAAAQTAFNPARVMGVLLIGVNALVGSPNVSASLTGAGFVAGSGAQAGNLTGDMAYGFWYRIKSSWQFWTQASTIIVCAFVSAFAFYMIRTHLELSLDGAGGLAAPVAKTWATMGLLFDPASKLNLPPFAVGAMWIGGLLGVLWAYLESKEYIRRWIPCAIGFGLGLILPVMYDFGFFLGGVLMWIVLPRFLRVTNTTLTTIAIACIVGEGIGGMAQAGLKIAGVISVAK